VSNISGPAGADVAVPHVLREYALLADGERGVVVGPRGDYSWMCFPQWHDEACFATLIGGQGTYAVTPLGRFVWGGYYEQGLIWRSRWTTEDGVVECREALALPSTPDRAVLLRRLTALDAPARVRVVLDLRTGFGVRRATRLRRTQDGAWRAQLGEARVTWIGGATAEPREDGRGGRPLSAVLELEPGGTHDLVLVLDASDGDEPPPEADTAWSATEAAWQDRVPEFGCARAERDARHAYAVMSGLTGSGGGMVAAATMSLPERAREGRSYDYRYVWIRDQCLAGQAVAAADAGAGGLLDDAVRFVSGRLLEDGAKMVPAYTVNGDAVPDEDRLGLPGYPGGTDIVGNWVNQQFQLDAFGESLLLLAAAARHDRLDADHWRAAETAADAIERRWEEADAGIWELEPDHWTHSRLICVAGLRAIAEHQPADRGRRWLALADTILAETAQTGVHSSGRWQRSPGDERVDAALLLPAIRGGVGPDDPRALATLRAVESELTQDGYCYRYRPDPRPLGEAEGAFLLCGFLLALAHQQQGNEIRASQWFERSRMACGPSGLLSEEYDVAQRQLRGNLPQAFVHAGLLQCALTLDGASGGP
jgi:GH15 family glucan-1,4-alpha-glucosidase